MKQLIGQTTIELRPLRCGAYMIVTRGECIGGKIVHRHDRAMTEYYLAVRGVNDYYNGREQHD